MEDYMFLVAHGFNILKGYVKAQSFANAKLRILNRQWEDIIDEYDSDYCVDGYDIIEIWKDGDNYE